MKKIIISTLTFASLFVASCRPATNDDGDVIKVLASTTFLGDIAQHIAGDRLKVGILLPFGADPHAYQAAPADVTKISQSTVLIINGIEYEHFIEPLLENADGNRLVIDASAGLEPRHLEEHAEETGDGDEHKAGDPHMWLDPNLVVTYVQNIRDGLIRADPQGVETYMANADSYKQQLKDLDAWIVEQVNIIPLEQRLLVTNHEALGYFAERYGFKFVDAILPSFSSEANASAQQIAAAVDAVKSSGARAIFLDEVENADLADQISAETGVKIVNDLHLESLTDGPPAGTYIEMIRHNVSLIVGALK